MQNDGEKRQGRAGRGRGLILCVIDALSPPALREAIATGGAPTLAALAREADLFESCCAAFPSVTPVCAASIATGSWQHRHRIPAMCWFDRNHHRYVEYGSSFRAAQRVGIPQQLTDTIYNLNRTHLAPSPPTVFERLDDAGLRTAATTYLVFRGRHRHRPRREGISWLAAPLLRHTVLGPRELFYADLFASRQVRCSSLLGMPGARDQHSACVAAHLVAHDLCDFLLLSLPDNDWYSHRHGPGAQLRSLAAADRQLERVVAAAGGLERLLDRYAVVVMGDHSQAPVRELADLGQLFESWSPLAPRSRGPAALALCPSQRSAQLYLLDGAPQRERSALAAQALRSPAVELACYRRGGEAVVRRRGTGELRFAPKGELRDRRGGRWSVEGDLRALALELQADRVDGRRFPDALSRIWAALDCPTSGDVLLSAAPGYEFKDLGGAGHPGGGSHGSLRAEDSLTALLAAGLEGAGKPRAPLRIADASGIVARHFGLP